MASHPAIRTLPPLFREILIGCAILLAVAASRHVSLGYSAELSADESELLVQLGRYANDPIPWRSVDGSTIGPVTPGWLLLLHQAGWPMTYAGLHVLAAGLFGLIVLCGYATVRLFLPDGAAGVAGLAGVVAVAGCNAVDFLYFATELLPALALGFGVFTLIWCGQKRPAALPVLVLGALSSGLAPWAKLQAAPVSLLLIIFAAWNAWSLLGPSRPRTLRLGAVALVLASAVLPTLLIVGVVAFAGAFPDFWASYIIANLGYAGPLAAGDFILRFGLLLQRSELNGLLAGLAALAVLHVATQRERSPTAGLLPKSTRALAGLYLGAAIFACLRPPHGFAHYDIFLIGPLILSAGVLLHGLWPPTGESHATSGRKLGAWAAVCLLAPTLALSTYHYSTSAPLRRHLALLQRDADGSLTAVVSREIIRMQPRAKTMVVWGWMPRLYLQAGLHCATRQTNSHFLIDATPSRDFIRSQFMRDVRASEPDVIVDAVASDCFTWYWDIASSRIESFPELAAYVRARYTLVLSVSGDQTGTPLRVFLKNPPRPPPSS